MKKALLTTISANPVMQDDLRAFQVILGSEWQVTIKTLGELGRAFDYTVPSGADGLPEYPFEEYDLIALSVSYSAMYVSNTWNLAAVNEIFRRAKPGALTLLTTDTTLPLDPFMWNSPGKRMQTRMASLGIDPGPIGISGKMNPYLARPIKVIGTFSENILKDPKAMAHIQRIWMSKLHPESEFIPVEWLSGMIQFVPQELRTKLSELPKSSEDIHNFYFGLNKKKIVPSLKKLKFGENSRDAVFGAMGKNFPEVRDLSTEKRFLNNQSSWLSLVATAERNLLPYDPIKGDYQFTKRFLEISIPNRDSVIPDEQLERTGLTRYLEEKAWWETAKESSKLLNELF